MAGEQSLHHQDRPGPSHSLGATPESSSVETQDIVTREDGVVWETLAHLSLLRA